MSEVSKEVADVVNEFLSKTGGRLILDNQNRVTITRPAQAAKSTKDVDTPAVVGVEVSAYSGQVSLAAKEALDTFVALVKELG
jgi:hypothetical protein